MKKAGIKINTESIIKAGDFSMAIEDMIEIDENPAIAAVVLPTSVEPVKKKDAVDGNENAQYEWMVEEVNEFYEAVNNKDEKEIKDEAMGLIRTYQQFNIDSVKKLWKKVKKDIAT
jgi:hypothetical protein